MVQESGPSRQAYLLLDYTQRLDRHREDRRAVHIHLSRLKPQNRREQHIRVAVNTLEDLLKQFDGQIFSLTSCDIVCICKGAKITDIDEAVTKLRFLFSEDPLTQTPQGETTDRFCTWYSIEKQYPEFLALAEQLHGLEEQREKRLAAAARESGEAKEKDTREFMNPEQLGKLEEFLARTDLSSVIRRQPICAIVGENPPQAVFRELYVSIMDLASTVLPEVNLAGNPWLFQHLTQTLDVRMLKHLEQADDSEIFSSLSINLNIATVLGTDFLEFDSSLRTGSRGTIVVELQPMDVFADFNAFMFARDFLREKGYRVCLDGIGISLFEFIDRKKLGLDLVKLFWSPEIGDSASEERQNSIRAQITELGRSRVILSRCDNAAAIRTGQELGISLYQGRHVDALLSGARNESPIPRPQTRRRTATIR
jgi:EAL domain-containing protein (putative c-di-GMP-specific phosphodiesterase class I)